MPRKTISKMRVLAALLLVVYLGFSWAVIRSLENATALHWMVGAILGAYCADLLSGLAHMYIDFAVSNRKNPVHKELFLSRVHHHELFRPARLNFSSLWFSPALYGFSVLAVVPALPGMLAPFSGYPDWILTFWLSLVWLASFAQITHAFAHGKARHSMAGNLIRLLQTTGLIIHPEKHLVHHREIDCNFSVLNGWSAPLLNVVFKRWIESLISVSTSPERQKADMKLNLSYPYEEIL